MKFKTISTAKKFLLVSIGLLFTHVVAYWYGSRVEPTIITKVDTIVKTDVKTIVKTIVKPDGTTIKTERITDKSVTNEKSFSASNNVQDKRWLIGGYIKSNGTYEGELSRRVLGPTFISVSASTTGQLSVGLKLEF